ncbi:MAG TPA: hopanoid-associated sugar epimerase [Casimicrobiaceae bacterium]|nr:hopanoid-associated sugar epimerase [Casimicrobiaceae bacterium]
MSESRRVLVTGASGFVGSAIVRAFLGTGYTVRALVRAVSRPDNLAGLSIEIAQGDIRDPTAVARAVAGTSYLVHAAADYRLWARDPGAIVRTNVEGTRIMMQAALAARVERIVHTSSVATLAPRADGEAADETQRLPETGAVGAYKRSKVVAERLVEKMISHDGLPAVIVHPSTPVGPRDIRPTPTGRVIVAAASGRMPAFVDTGLNLVHVDDVAAGHVAALERGAIGERYILGGENVPLADMLRDIARLVGGRPPRLELPRAPLYPLAAAAQMLATLTGREPLLTLDGLRMSRKRMFFTSAKAERDLGFRARPYVEGLRDAIDWFRAAGYLR